MNMNNSYSQYLCEETTLRDVLAVDRTVLANERTMLAYVRTALGFLILGLTFLHFLEELYYHLAGYAFMAFAAIIMLVGITRFVQLGRALKRVRQRSSARPAA
jgi:putative membrane protein